MAQVERGSQSVTLNKPRTLEGDIALRHQRYQRSRDRAKMYAELVHDNPYLVNAGRNKVERAVGGILVAVDFVLPVSRMIGVGGYDMRVARQVFKTLE